MAKEKIHGALRRVQVGRGDGWRVWRESLDCCFSGYAQDARVSMVGDCNSLHELCVRVVSSANRSQEMERSVQEVMVEETSGRKDIYQGLSPGVVDVK